MCYISFGTKILRYNKHIAIARLLKPLFFQVLDLKCSSAIGIYIRRVWRQWNCEKCAPNFHCTLLPSFSRFLLCPSLLKQKRSKITDMENKVNKLLFKEYILYIRKNYPNSTTFVKENVIIRYVSITNRFRPTNYWQYFYAHFVSLEL